MIGFVKGTLAEKGAGYVIIEAGGIGYEIFVPANSAAYLSCEGDEVKVYTMMSVREDDVSLYGFSRRGELDAFKKLISVNGVGAKAGISILSAFTLEQLQEAIAFEDAKALTKANGVGKKIAERIVLELKDKFAASVESGMESAVISDGEQPAAGGGRAEAVAALISLGYTRGEATSALAHIKDNDLSAEDYIKAALKNLI